MKIRYLLGAAATLCIAAPASATVTVSGSGPAGDIFGCCVIDPYLTSFTLYGANPFAEIFMSSSNGFHFGTADVYGNFSWSGSIALDGDRYGEFYAPVRATDGVHPTSYGGISSWTAIGDPNVARVPEPATWLMMLLGFGLMGFVLRREVSSNHHSARRSIRGLHGQR